MPAVAFVIRFPNGDYEYDLSRRIAPTIGETIGRRGMLWSVMNITHADVTTAHVERVRIQEAPDRSTLSVSRQRRS